MKNEKDTTSIFSPADLDALFETVDEFKKTMGVLSGFDPNMPHFLKGFDACYAAFRQTYTTLYNVRISKEA